MLKGWMHDLALMLQARSGVTVNLVVWWAIAALAVLTAFAFLCVAAYAWLSLQIGNVFAALVMAALFALIALIVFATGAIARQRARERAILERAARAHAPSWLLDPKLLATAMQVGRSIGWQRLIPVALVGFMAAQWVRERREQAQSPAE